MNLAIPILAAALTAILATSADAQSAADIARGKSIAEQWCSSCHVEDAATAERILPEIVTFTEVAKKGGLTPERLTAILAAPHPAMPELSLSRSQIADLSAYVSSLTP